MKRFFITFFLGMFGVHKFMDHKTGQGILYLFTLGLFGIGWIIDCIKALKDVLTHSDKEKFTLEVDPSMLHDSPVDITPITGSNHIQGIKNYNKGTILALQQLSFPSSENSRLSEKQIIDGCEMIISNANRILDDCKHLINNTENPRVFFERYELLIEELNTLAEYEPYLLFYGYQPLESLVYYNSSKESYEKKLIDRCYNKALINADPLKTDKGKRNQFIKMYDALFQFKDKMTPNSVLYLHNKFKQKLQ